MGDFLRSAISAIPTVATNPLAFVAYIVVIIAWVIIAWRVKRNSNLLKSLDKLPENDRLAALQLEMGTVRLAKGLSPSQYVRSRIHFYYFLGFSILCLVVVIIFVVSAFKGPEIGTAEGYVFYQRKEASAEALPVEGAEVEIPANGLKGRTDANGRFVILNVPRHLAINELVVRRGGRTHNVKVQPDGHYYIPREPEIVQSNRQRFPDEAWVEDATGLCPPEKKEFGSTKQFSLTTRVPTLAGYTNLLVEVQSAQEMKILKARKLEPSSGSKVETEDESTTQRWEVPINSPEVTLALSVCLAIVKKNVAIPKPRLQTQYWFEKAE